MRKSVSDAMRTLLYLFAVCISLWLLFVVIALLVRFMYMDNWIAWIPYLLLGGWVPGKLYGLTLLHALWCIGTTMGIIGVADNRITLDDKSRFVTLVLVLALFVYEAVFNLFMNADDLYMSQYEARQTGLLQLVFAIGIAIKAWNKYAEMD